MHDGWYLPRPVQMALELLPVYTSIQTKVGWGVTDSSLRLNTNPDHSYETNLYLIIHGETIQPGEGTNINYATLIKGVRTLEQAS